MTINADTTYAKIADFGDGVPTYETIETTIPTVETIIEEPATNKAVVAFGVIATIIGQAVMTMAIATGGNPFIGIAGVIAIAAIGMGFAVIAGGAGNKGTD